MTTQNKQTRIVQLIASHQMRLRGFLRCLFVDEGDIDDLLQDINAVLWEKSDSFELGTDFWAWSSQVARLTVFNYLRKRKRDPLIFERESIERLAVMAESRVAEFDQQSIALKKCIDHLPANQRRLVELRYFSELGIDAISETIKRPAGSISQALYRIRKALMSCINRRLQSEGGDG